MVVLNRPTDGEGRYILPRFTDPFIHQRRPIRQTLAVKLDPHPRKGGGSIAGVYRTRDSFAILL
jgi:hypothetical protein